MLFYIRGPMRTFAKTISIIFHPLLFATYGTALVIFANPHLFGQYNIRQQMLWVIVVFALTFLFPSIWLIMMKRLGLITSLQLEEKNERIIPYIATATFYLWAYRMFKPTPSNVLFSSPLVSNLLLGACVALFIGFFINIFRKVSLHAIGAGCFLGLMLPLMRMSTYDLRLVFTASIIIAGIIGTARLMLDAHDEGEIYLGYFVGFSGMFAAFTILPRLF